MSSICFERDSRERMTRVKRVGFDQQIPIGREGRERVFHRRGEMM